VTVLASLYRGASVAGSPLIRTADADRIAGVKDPAHTVPSPGRSSPPRAAGSRGSSSGAPLTWSLAGAGFVALLAGGLIWRRRRRSLGPVEDAAN
jgi:LPXTG-motif cell wall-anchored protein